MTIVKIPATMTTMLTVALTLLLLVHIPWTVGQGMVPLSEVIDHKPTPQKKTNSPLSPDKVDTHVKIAKSHLSAPHHDHDSSSSSLTEDSSRITRKDKPLSLQNPEKHASEEFVLQFFLNQYPKSQNDDERLEILENLQNFAHKFENGRDLFKSTTALQQILLPALNSTSTSVRVGACGVFAIAAQNNHEVQKEAEKAGVIRRMVHLMSFDTPEVRSKALFALSALVRNFPRGQAKFIKDGGVSALVSVASRIETRKRALNFVADLLSERNFCRIDSEKQTSQKQQVSDSLEDEDPCDSFKTLEKALKQSGWCDVLADIVKNLPGFETDDQILTSEAVASSLSFCHHNVENFLPVFRHLLAKFQANEEFKAETEIVKSILEQIQSASGLKEEL